jgi:hypothetical protein
LLRHRRHGILNTMLKIEDVLQMKDGEAIQEIVRRHWLTLVAPLAISLLLIVVPFFFLFPLFSWGAIGVAGFVLSLLAGIAVAIRAFLLWDANVLIVTSLRLVDVDQRGIFTRIVSDASLSSIRDISWARRGIIETLFHIGSLRIETTSAYGAINVERISAPERLNERINDLRRHTSPHRTDIAPERRSRLRKIAGILEAFSDEELDKIEAILKARERAEAVEHFAKKEKA